MTYIYIYIYKFNIIYNIGLSSICHTQIVIVMTSLYRDTNQSTIYYTIQYTDKFTGLPYVTGFTISVQDS
jgi:hypothetical protein